MEIGFIGLGKMGAPIALNLARHGARLIIPARGSADIARFLSQHSEIAAGPEAFSRPKIVFLCLPNGEIVRDVLFGKAGVAKDLRPGQIVVNLSTTTHSSALAAGEGLSALGVDFLDAPVSGMQARAAAGTLTVMCGGERSVFQRVEPLLRQIGSTIIHCGGAGSGQLMKLVNQLLFDMNSAALAEILPMAVKLGLAPDDVAEVVNSGTGRSYASEFFIPRILKNEFSDGYAMSLAYKDLVSAAELCSRRCIPTPVLAAATATYQAALLQGHGHEDKGGMVRVFEDLLGVSFRSMTGSLVGSDRLDV